jgi:OOP family OmpA-OmpF porin
MTRKNIVKILFPFLVLALLMGCATQKASPVSKAGDLNMKMKSGECVLKADNIEILLDKSGTMGDAYGGVQKLAIEKSLASKFNSYIYDLNINAGVRTFGQNLANFDVTNLVYGIAKYDPNGVEGAIQNMRTPYGDSPLDKAILAAGNDLKTLPGSSALVIFTDAVQWNMFGPAAWQAATSVKKQYGDKLCIYTVQIGNDAAGAKFLNEIVAVGQCGVAVKGDDLANDSAMNAFVNKIFCAAPAAVAPPPPPVTEMEKKLEKGRATLDVKFDFDKSVVKPEYYKDIEAVADVMKKHPDMKIMIEGHTDSVGTAKYNQKLSQRRAEAIKKVMETKYNIDPSRLTAKGFGESKPVATNKTAEGRHQNRRSEASVTYMIEK